MKFKSLILPFLSLIILSACSDKNDEPGGGEISQSGKYTLSGKVEKGPFVRGSSISVQPLNDSLNPVGTVFNSEISDDAGNFNLGQIDSQFIRLAADGYYFNEFEGSLSKGPLHLVAYADISNRSSINVNILTHLKSARIQKLMQGGASFSDADKQAQKELFAQFKLQAYENIPAESMTISSGNDGAGVLIAISTLVLVGRSDAEITQYLSNLSQDLADDGVFTEDNKNRIYNDSYNLRPYLNDIADNIINRYSELGYYVAIPDLRYYFDWDNDGIAGNELSDNVQVTLSQTELHFDKNGGSVEIAVTSNVPVYLEVPTGGNMDITPPDVVVGDDILSDFFESTGEKIKVEKSYNNNILTIKVNKTEQRAEQNVSVSLYDVMGNEVAKVAITLDGDPSIQLNISSTGKSYINDCYGRFARALSWDYYVERGYTGMYKFYDVECPLSPNNRYNYNAFSNTYSAIVTNNYITTAMPSEYTGLFQLIKAIIYTEAVDKWGNVGISENALYGDVPQQESRETVLNHIENLLDNISTYLSDTKAPPEFTSADQIFDISKDVWRIAKANLHLAKGQYSDAASYLQQLIDSNRYSLSSDNEYYPNSGTILFFNVSDDVMPGHGVGYYNYADVLLLMAECKYKLGDNSTVTSLINKVAQAKGISTTGNIIADIDNIRLKLYLPRYFAFQKRNNLGGYADYQKLWPIPFEQIMLSNWQQNPGY